MRKTQWSKIFQVYGVRDQIEKFKIFKNLTEEQRRAFGDKVTLLVLSMSLSVLCLIK